MAAIRERRKADGSAVFHVQVRQAGFPARTETFPTRRQAERWAKTIEAEMIEGRHFRNADSRRRTVAQAIERYMEEELPKKRSAGMHTAALAWWKSHLGKLKLAEVTPAIIVEYRGKLAREPFTRADPKAKRTSLKADEQPEKYIRSNGTVNRYLACLSHLFTMARKEWHWIGHNPFDGVAKLRESKGRVRCLTDEERARLLEQTTADPTLHAVVVIALSTAARAGELLRLQWRDIDIEQGRLVFRVTKNGEPRAVHVFGEALRLLKERSDMRSPDVQTVFPGAGGKGVYDYHKPFAEAVAAASIADLRFHDLRHSAATYLAIQGASEQQLRAIGGWKSNVVNRYVHMASTDAMGPLQRLAAKIDGKPMEKSDGKQE